MHENAPHAGVGNGREMMKSGEQDRYGAAWTREELVAAFDLYCRIPFSKTKADNPEVMDLARLLRRSPGSVARKLGNFGSFDPELQRRRITGLPHVGKLDRLVWDEYHSNWNELVFEARRVRHEVFAEGESEYDDEGEVVQPDGPSERETTRRARIHQSFFRQTVLSSYEYTCCITGLRIPECLVASHIIPWSVGEQHRADPRNGLCLSATFDRLFDRGLIAVTTDLRVLVSDRLRRFGDKRVEEMVCVFDGAPIVRSRRFLPLAEHLEWHIRNVFQGEQ